MRPPTGRHQDAVRLTPLLPPRHSCDDSRPAVGEALHAYRLSARTNIDAFLAQDRFQCPRDLFIFPRQDAITALQHRHLDSQPMEDLPELHSLWAAADDEQ